MMDQKKLIQMLSIYDQKVAEVRDWLLDSENEETIHQVVSCLEDPEQARNLDAEDLHILVALASIGFGTVVAKAAQDENHD